jgi:hypothetical protein
MFDNTGETDTFTAEALVASIAAERPRKSNKCRPDADLRAAVERFGDDNVAISEALRASVSSINRARGRLGLRRRVMWNTENRRKLFAMATRIPRVSNEEMAQAFNTTVTAITCALSRNGVTAAGEGGSPRDLAVLKTRKCLTCSRPFASEHRLNFICRPCNAWISETAA